MDQVCPIHQVPPKTIPAGVSKKTGKPYPAFQVCAVDGCDWKPEKGWPAVREQAAAKVAPEKAIMTEEKWDAIKNEKTRNILLQVAFKAAVELAQHTNLPTIGNEGIFKRTLEFHSWLLSQTEGQKVGVAAKFDPNAGTLNAPIVHTPPMDNEPPIEAYEDPESYAPTAWK